MGFKHTPTEQVQRVLRKDHLKLQAPAKVDPAGAHIHTEPDMMIAVLRGRGDLAGDTFAKYPLHVFFHFYDKSLDLYGYKSQENLI